MIVFVNFCNFLGGDKVYLLERRLKRLEEIAAALQEDSLLVTDKEYMRIADIIKGLPQKGRFTNVR